MAYVMYFAVFVQDVLGCYGCDELVNSSVLDLAVLIPLEELYEWIVGSCIVIMDK